VLLMREADRLLQWLKEGFQLDVQTKRQQLTELKRIHKHARVAQRNAETALLNAEDLHSDDEADRAALASLAQMRADKRAKAQASSEADVDFLQGIADLARLADDHAPELWPDIVAKANKTIRGELQTLPSHDQQRVLNGRGPMQEVTETMIADIPSDRTAAKEKQYDSFFQARENDQRSVDNEEATRASLKPPHYWVQGSYYHWHLEPQMVAVVQKLITDTTCVECHNHGLAMDVTVEKVFRVESTLHWRSFAANRHKLKVKNARWPKHTPVKSQLNQGLPDSSLDHASNEVYLWHGLPASKVPVVAKGHLDNRMANCRGLYGDGIYLTDQWCKALQYTRAGKCSIRHNVCGEKRRCRCVGPKRALLCRAAMGEAYYVPKFNNLSKRQQWPPERTDTGPGVAHDSVVAEPERADAGEQAHREFVLFDQKSVYPEWIIELSWQSGR